MQFSYFKLLPLRMNIFNRLWTWNAALFFVLAYHVPVSEETLEAKIIRSKDIPTFVWSITSGTCSRHYVWHVFWWQYGHSSQHSGSLNYVYVVVVPWKRPVKHLWRVQRLRRLSAQHAFRRSGGFGTANAMPAEYTSFEFSGVSSSYHCSYLAVKILAHCRFVGSIPLIGRTGHRWPILAITCKFYNLEGLELNQVCNQAWYFNIRPPHV